MEETGQDGVLTAPTGNASTAIIQSLRPISFFSWRSCSLLSAPLVSRLDTSIRTHSPKNTAWITCRRKHSHQTQQLDGDERSSSGCNLHHVIKHRRRYRTSTEMDVTSGEEACAPPPPPPPCGSLTCHPADVRMELWMSQSSPPEKLMKLLPHTQTSSRLPTFLMSTHLISHNPT